MKRAICLLVLLCTTPAIASAQERDDRDRRTGIRAGSFVFKPEASVSQSYESNYRHRDANEEDTGITVLRPALVVESDLSRHALRVLTYGEFGFYTADSDDDFIDYGARLDAVADITRDHRLLLSGGFRHDHETRGGDDVPNAAAEPVEFDRSDVRLAGDLNFGRFRFEPFAYTAFDNFDDVRLNDGTVSNQDDRDRRRLGGGLEVGYAVRSGYEAFVRGEVYDVKYDDAFDDSGVNRDSDGFRVLGGVNVDLTRLIEASVGFGYEDRDYDDARLDDFAGFSVSSDVRWEITRRTSLFANVEREVDETTVNGASSRVDFGGSIGVEHELLRNLGLFAGTGYFNRDFEGIARNDDILFARAGAEWDFSRYASVNLEYDFEYRDSNTSGFDYDNHIVLVSLRVFY